jgi:superfamily II DNA or RNA helicase
MATAKLIIRDEVNIKIDNVDPATRRKMSAALKFMLPYAYHMPAYKLGRWDGMIRFCDVGGRTYLNLLDTLLPILQNAGYDIEIDDHRQTWNLKFEQIDENYLSSIQWPKGHTHEGQDIVLRDYQIDAINNFLEHLQSLQEIATAAGKTIITATLSKLCEQYGRTIVIVPNKSLVTQTEEDYRNIGLDVGVFYGDRKDYGHQHTICTWQSLNVLLKKSKKKTADINIQEFIDGVICIMVDEVHQAKADVLKELLTGVFANVPIRWGLTGTIPKAEYEFISLKASLGEVINRISAHSLQEQGVLSNCEVKVLQLKDDVGYPNYPSELKYLSTDANRIDYLATVIKDIANAGNTFVLIDRIKTGEMLIERIPDAMFVRGATKNEERKETYDEVATGNDSLIIATYGVASVGINIPRIFNLVLIEPGKSFVRVIQSIGRGIRKAHDKDFVQIWDITSNCKYSKRHLTTRKKYYREAKYDFHIEKISYK